MNDTLDERLIMYYTRLENIRHHQNNILMSFIKKYKWNIEDTKEIERMTRKIEKEIKQLRKEFKDIL